MSQLQDTAPTTDRESTPPDDATPLASRRMQTLGPGEHLKVVHPKHWVLWILSVVAVFAVAQFAWSLVTNERYEWGVFGEYFFSPIVLNALVLTLQLTVLSGVIGFILGALLAVARLSDGAHRNSPELLIGIPQVAWSG